jgi:glucose/arabinose dehydrogenase
MKRVSARAIRSMLVLAVSSASFLGFVACGEDFGGDPQPLGEAGNAAEEGAASSDGPINDASAAETDGAPVRADFGLDERPKNGTCVAAARPQPPAKVVLERVYPNLSVPGGFVMLEMPPRNVVGPTRDRWFGAQLNGMIVSFPSTGSPTAVTVAADLPTVAGIPLGMQGESGLLGLAFHPKFADNGRLYVSWNSADGPSGIRSRIGYLTSNNGGETFTSYTNVLAFDQPGVFYHHGGGIAFGTDGFLYASFGDGGDPTRGGKTATFFSKVIRIDVDTIPSGQTYGVPTNNPFASADASAYEPATFAYGFRNPFRLSIDRATGEVWVGDVGSQDYEEIDRLKSGGDYGWDCREGAHPHKAPSNALLCQTVKRGEIDPTIDVPRDVLTPHAIVGGLVYRGRAIPSLVGSYVFGDFSSEVRVAHFDPTTGTPSIGVDIDDGTEALGSFAEDRDGEIYAVHHTGSIYKVVAAPDAGTPTDPFPSRLSQSGCDPRQPLTTTGLLSYDINARAWNDGADSQRWFSIPDGTTMTVDSEGRFALPIGSVAVESFIVAGQNI